MLKGLDYSDYKNSLAVDIKDLVVAEFIKLKDSQPIDEGGLVVTDGDKDTRYAFLLNFKDRRGKTIDFEKFKRVYGTDYREDELDTLVVGGLLWIKVFIQCAKESFPKHCNKPTTDDKGNIIYPEKFYRALYCDEYIISTKNNKIVTKPEKGTVYSIHNSPIYEVDSEKLGALRIPGIGTLLTKNGKLKVELIEPNSEHKAMAILRSITK